MLLKQKLAALVAADPGQGAGVLMAANTHAIGTLACIVGAHADRPRSIESFLKSVIGNGMPA